MTIRIATEPDCSAMAAIYRPFVEESVVSFEEVPPDAEEFFRRVQKAMEKHIWLVAEIDDVVAGFAYSGPYRERTAYQWMAETSIYIHPDYRKRKVASSLYTVLHNVMRSQGYVRSFAGMTLPNEPSKRFHEHFGYRAFARYENSGYKFGHWHSTEWYYLDLVSLPKTPQEIRSIAEFGEEELRQHLINW